jgi:chemotaxis protein histidine kinase CheA
MHTIKGNARIFEFSHITDTAHLAEQGYDRLRRGEATWLPDELRQELDAVAQAVQLYVHTSEEKLGRKGRALDLQTTRGVFVATEQLAELRRLVVTQAAAHPEAHLEALQEKIVGLGLVSLQRILSGSIDSLSSLAKELGKPAPALELLNGDIGFNAQFAEPLKSSLMHIGRNSMDHGIELPAQRVAAGKAEEGTIRVRCEMSADQVLLHISDDGQGLALGKLYQQGVAQSVFSPDSRPTRGAVADLIFRSGLSTAERVTQVSGRGVGMDAVRTFLKEQGATIRIELEDPDGFELNRAPFEFVVSVPQSACRN